MKEHVYRLLDRLFTYEPIPRQGPTVLHRWILWRGRTGSAVYLHEFVQSEPRDPHDHPKRFTTIGIRGRYREMVYKRDRLNRPSIRWYRAPWIRWFQPEHIHRIELAPGETCWTLALVGPAVVPWGFYVPNKAVGPGTNPLGGANYRRIDPDEYHHGASRTGGEG